MKVVMLSLLFAVFTSCGPSRRPALPEPQACPQWAHRKIDLPGASVQIITSAEITTIAFAAPRPAQLDAGLLHKLADCLHASGCGRALQPVEMASLRKRVQRSASELVNLAGQPIEISHDRLGTLVVIHGRADVSKVLSNLLSGVHFAPCRPEGQCPNGPQPDDRSFIPTPSPGCPGPEL
jgi:hypothetical protein